MSARDRQRGATLAEFALAWPLLLLTVMGAVQLSTWALGMFTCRSAALAGARAGSTGTAAAPASAVASAALATGVFGVAATAWCPGSGTPPRLWVCATNDGQVVEVRVGGGVPAIVPLVPGGTLPVQADVRMLDQVYR